MKQPGLAPGRSRSHPHAIGSWDLNHKNSSVGFSIEQFNLVSRPFRRVTGKFQVYTGAIQAFFADFNEAKINFSVVVGSIYTGNAKRDRHLRSSTFFNAQQFPVMKFKSVVFIKVPGDRYILEGDLSICGVSRRIVFDVEQDRLTNELNGQIAKFKISGKINRLDFDIRGTALSEIFISKEVTISLQLEFLKQQI
jgi:polyisoprenoid-binding protein YceI